MTTHTYSYARQLEGVQLNLGDTVLFGPDTYEVYDLDGQYFLYHSTKVNDSIFDELGVEKFQFCGVETAAGGGFPFHNTLSHLTDTVKKLLREYQTQRLKKASANELNVVAAMIGLSPDTVFRMCQEQVKQGNLFDPKVFIGDRFVDINEGGFKWSSTNEGYEYWNRLLNDSFRNTGNTCNSIPTTDSQVKRLAEMVALRKHKNKKILLTL